MTVIIIIIIIIIITINALINDELLLLLSSSSSSSFINAFIQKPNSQSQRSAQKEMNKPGNKNWTDQSSALLPNNVN
jgi:hypothetical protein